MTKSVRDLSPVPRLDVVCPAPLKLMSPIGANLVLLLCVFIASRRLSMNMLVSRSFVSRRNIPNFASLLLVLSCTALTFLDPPSFSWVAKFRLERSATPAKAGLARLVSSSLALAHRSAPVKLLTPPPNFLADLMSVMAESPAANP